MQKEEQSQSFTIEATLDDNIRTFSLTERNWNQLNIALIDAFNFQESNSFVVKYQDSEGDLITISSTIELETALEQNEDKEILQLFIRGNVPIYCNNGNGRLSHADKLKRREEKIKRREEKLTRRHDKLNKKAEGLKKKKKKLI